MDKLCDKNLLIGLAGWIGLFKDLDKTTKFIHKIGPNVWADFYFNNV